MLTDLAFCRQLPVLSNTSKLSDGILTALITVASKATERWCGRTLSLATYTDVILNGSGSREILLPMFPVATVTALAFRNGTNDYNDVDITQLEFDTDPATSDGSLYFLPEAVGDYTFFPRGFRNVKVSYTAGYDTIPEDLQFGVAMWTAYLYSSSSKKQDKVSETIGKYSYTNNIIPAGAAADPPADARMYVAPYRRLRV